MVTRETIFVVILGLVAGSSRAARPARAELLDERARVWPGRDWQTATPESQGLSSQLLDAAAEYALQHGGGSGCIIRHGHLVKEWGDPRYLADIKSATKGSFGTTCLGLAVDRGLVRLEDSARTHYPNLGVEKEENVATGWLDEITVRHLATMTAGFDDGRPPRLVYRPGTKGIYSNDGSNMLAELLTLRFGEDLSEVMRREVLEPIGVAPAEWSWRENNFRARTINSLKSREFASGVRITHRTLARIGYLYLCGGEWNGRRIISKEFIRAATQPADLPAFVPYYAFYWGSNARGTYADMPKDAYWALGLGDSFVAVCPSLDLVAVRLGVGSNQSRLPGDPDDTDWGKRVAGFFKLVAAATSAPPTKGASSHAPYPASPVAARIDWAPKETIVRKAKGGDNWPLTWADDDALYTAYGDGRGFEPFVPGKLSVGVAKITGRVESFQGINIRAPTVERQGDGVAGPKASGILMVEGVLYLWLRNLTNSQLVWSADHGQTWAWSDWKFTTSFGCPTFLNFGKNYAGARDDYVYVYSPDADSAYVPADRFVLARAPKHRIRERDAYQFFNRLDSSGGPTWTRNIAARGAVFMHAGKCYRSGITYNAGQNRYLWCQVHPDSKDPRGPRFQGGFGIYDAPEPWGPWTTVFYTGDWDVGPGETSSFPTKWMSADGKTLHLVFSGDDSFAVRRATLTFAEE